MPGSHWNGGLVYLLLVRGIVVFPCIFAAVGARAFAHHSLAILRVLLNGNANYWQARWDAWELLERWFGLFGAGIRHCGVSEHFSSSRRPSICPPLAGHSPSLFERKYQQLACTLECLGAVGTVVWSIWRWYSALWCFQAFFQQSAPKHLSTTRWASCESV